MFQAFSKDGEVTTRSNCLIKVPARNSASEKRFRMCVDVLFLVLS